MSVHLQIASFLSLGMMVLHMLFFFPPDVNCASFFTPPLLTSRSNSTLFTWLPPSRVTPVLADVHATVEASASNNGQQLPASIVTRFYRYLNSFALFFRCCHFMDIGKFNSNKSITSSSSSARAAASFPSSHPTRKTLVTFPDAAVDARVDADATPSASADQQLVISSNASFHAEANLQARSGHDEGQEELLPSTTTETSTFTAVTSKSNVATVVATTFNPSEPAVEEDIFIQKEEEKIATTTTTEAAATTTVTETGTQVPVPMTTATTTEAATTSPMRAMRKGKAKKVEETTFTATTTTATTTLEAATTTEATEGETVKTVQGENVREEESSESLEEIELYSQQPAIEDKFNVSTTMTMTTTVASSWDVLARYTSTTTTTSTNGNSISIASASSVTTTSGSVDLTTVRSDEISPKEEERTEKPSAIRAFEEKAEEATTLPTVTTTTVTSTTVVEMVLLDAVTTTSTTATALEEVSTVAATTVQASSEATTTAQFIPEYSASGNYFAPSVVKGVNFNFKDHTELVSFLNRIIYHDTSIFQRASDGYE